MPANQTKKAVGVMYEVIFPDADPAAVLAHNAEIEDLGGLIMPTSYVVETVVARGTGGLQIEFYRALAGGDVPVRQLRVERHTPPVDWGDTNYGSGQEVSAVFENEPEDRELQALLEELGASAYHLRKLEE